MKILNFLRRESLQILLLILPFALAAAWWNRIPATVVSHWGLHGEPDGWMPKTPGLLSVPLLNVGMCLLLAWLPSIDPRLRRDPSTGTARYRRTLRWCRYAITGFMSLLAMTIIAIAAGWKVDIARLACNGALVVFAIVGNFLGTLPPNYLMGVRTPWTLEDAATWRATHRLAGRVMVFGSVVLLVAGFLLSDTVLLGSLLAFIVGLGLANLGFSAWFFQRQRRLLR